MTPRRRRGGGVKALGPTFKRKTTAYHPGRIRSAMFRRQKETFSAGRSIVTPSLSAPCVFPFRPHQHWAPAPRQTRRRAAERRAAAARSLRRRQKAGRHPHQSRPPSVGPAASRRPAAELAPPTCRGGNAPLIRSAKGRGRGGGSRILLHRRAGDGCPAGAHGVGRR